MTADEGQATTTLFLEATRNGRHPIGVLTSTLDKFINGGTTTEYMTQHVGTYVDDKYAKIESTTSREYYRVISPTKASLSIGESTSLTKPTGLVASSVSYDVHGSQTTEYTVRQFRTYIDGHYAHLVSSISKVYSDPPIISATPVYDPFGRHTSSRLPKILPDKPQEPGTIPTVQVGSKRKQEKRIKLDDLFQDASDSKHHLDNNDIRPRSIEDEIKVSPVEDEEKLALPTFTVNSDGQLHIPTPSIEAIELENEIEPTVAHRFEPVNARATKTSLDSVTYIGFVDFTTTIDDTVVIFRPKKTFSTATRNIFIPKIEPTQTSDQRINLFKPSQAATPQLSSSSEEKSPENKPEQPRRSDGKISPNSNRLSDLFNNNNRLKSLLAASSSRRNKFSGKSTSSVENDEIASSSSSIGSIQPSLPTNFGGRPRITLLQRPNQASAPEVESSSRPNEAPEPGDISSSIDPNADVELVYKTLYTTYTYFTTFFRASSTRVKSREEVISNVVTLTNILGPSDLAKLKSSCEVDKTCQFISSTAVPSDFTDGFIGRPNTKASVINEEPRNSNNNVENNGVFKTFFTTYTYFTTLFVDGSNSISTRTEVYSNVQSSGVPVAATQAPPRLQSSAAPNEQVQASADPLRGSRRLEYSSIARGSGLTTEQEKVKKEENEAVILDTESPISDSLEEVDKIEPSQSLEFLEEIEQEVEEAINAEENQIDASSVVVIPSSVKTFYTTYTYFTTLFRNGTSYVTSNLETVTNTADATASPTLVQPSVTFYTTFTYWTTSIDGDKTVITSREETKTDILPAATALTDEILPTSIGIGIDAIDATRSPTFIEPSTEEISEISLSEDTTTMSSVPELESSGEADSSSLTPSSSLVVTPSLSSSEKVAEVSSSSVAGGFNELDDDFTLASSSINSSPAAEETKSVEESSITESSSSPKSRLTFTRPSSTFTPVIRPNLFRTRVRPNNRIRSRSKSTTVAIITRSDVTPTLIATPVSSQLQTASPVAFSSSSRNLASASLLSRSSSSVVASSSINPARASSLSSSVNLVSSSVINSSESAEEEEEESIEEEEEEAENVPNILSNLRVSNIRRRPDSFAARLKERQRARLQQLRLANTTPAIRGGGGVGGNNAPIFISTRTENFSRSRGNRINNVNNVVKKTPKVETEEEERVSSAESNIKLPPAIASQRDRARQRINALFRRRQPSFLRPRPPALNLDGSSSEADPLQVEASTRRRKRQVSSYGTRTRARQSYVRKYRSSSPDAQQSYAYQSPSSYTSFRNPYSSYSDSQYGTTSSNADLSSTYENDDSNLSYSSTSSASNKPSSTRWSSGSSSRRTVRQQDTSSLRTRGRSRFNPSRQRVGGRTTTTTTTTPRPSFSRFRPRTISSNRGTSNRFTSSGRRPSTSVFDYDDNYDYDYDYDVDLQSSQNSVPDAITVTHSVPVATQIPFFENGRNTFRDILTTSPSLEVVAVTALKSTNIDGSPVIYANVKTETPNLGTQVLTFEALRATETTAIEMTPTRIRGLRTSFSHVVPSTIYNIRPVTTSIVQQVDSNQLLSSLLLQLLGQKGLNPDLLGQTSQVPQLNLPQQAQKQNNPVLPQIAPPVVNPTPATQFITHTNSYVTTLTNVESTVLPITLRGRLIKTTLVESKTEVVTATELSTETKIRATPSAPAFGGLGGLGLPTAASPLSTLLPADLQQQLLVAQLQQQLQQQQQQLFNQQLLSQVNLDQEGAINVEQTQIPDIEPSTSVVTIFVSGSTPGDFTRITSTVTLTEEAIANNERYKRDLLRPSPVMPIAFTQAPVLDPANGL